VGWGVSYCKFFFLTSFGPCTFFFFFLLVTHTYTSTRSYVPVIFAIVVIN
jgi:hypothetical protein